MESWFDVIVTLLKQIGNLIIECMKNHQDDKCKNAENFLKIHLKDWNQLAETTLMSIQLFNRVGELERILNEDLKCYQGIDNETNENLFLSLDLQSKQITTEYVRFTIRGKLNRTVPILLDSNLLECVKLIIKYREHANVSVDNRHLLRIPAWKENSNTCEPVIK